MYSPVSIVALSSISSLGNTQEEVWNSYKNNQACFVYRDFPNFKAIISQLSSQSKEKIKALRNSNSKYKSLDDSVLFSIYIGREAIVQAGWGSTDNFGINIGSSRGATQLFESYHETFIKENKVKPLSSPTTTLGNLSSWVAQDLKTKGPEISHSITCSTALHSVLNGIAWINSGMCKKFLVGGSEAPLTAFTVAQMKALKIYSEEDMKIDEFPCKALDENKGANTMILGEGAALACLEKGKQDGALAVIEGIGYATELLEHNVSISAEADCFKESMKMALKNHNPDDIDIVVTHTPGTVKGDLSEIKAIQSIFNNKLPFLTTNKWKIGHTLGASGMLSLEMAVLMLQNQEEIGVPFLKNQNPVKKINNILVNAVGFGGNAVSILLSK